MRRRLIAAIVALAGLAGCTDGHTRSQPTSVTGNVIMGAPVSGATVTLYRIEPVSRRLSSLGTARTDTNGAYTILALVNGSPYLLVATGGTYKDDATASLQSLSVATLSSLDDPRPGVLETLVGSGGNPLTMHLLTPFTTIAARRISTLSSTNGQGALIENLVAQENRAVADGLNVGSEAMPVDPRTLLPLDFTNPSDAAAIKKNPLAPAALYGAALSGFSKLASTLALTSASPLIDALGEDFVDGRFDGMKVAPNGNASPAPLGSGTLSPTATSTDLQQATASFLDDPTKNTSGANAASVGPK